MYGDSSPKLWTPQPNWLDIFVYGVLCPKLWTPQPNWPDIFVYGDSSPKLWTPKLKWLDIFVYGVLCPKFWTPQPNWPDIFVYGVLCPKLWTPLPNWRDVFVHDDFRLKYRISQPKWHNAFTYRDGSKVVDPPDYVLVACLFRCSVTRISIRERFWSKVVDNLYKHPSNTYCNMFRSALKMDSSQVSTWTVRTSGRRQKFIPINKQLLSELCRLM